MGESMKISVTHLSAYIYCPRKLYLTLVKRLEEPPKDVLVKGSVRHETYEFINKNDEGIVKNIRDFDFDSIFQVYKQKHSRFLKKSISRNMQRIKKVGLSPSDVFRQAWPLVMAESRSRAELISSFIQKYEVFGDELWDMLTPRIMSEVRLESESLQLKGRVDCLEKYDDEYVPVELKTGQIPKQGVWPSHKIQIGAYALLIEDVLGSNVCKGYVDYLDSASKKRRKIVVNPFLKHEVQELVKRVSDLLRSDHAPPVCKNRNKCLKCGLREHCLK
ncbi:CRISPR-associated protein Cas4 [Candidatus Woesearchaeota archaeon]|nr:CRISPR-associated protein Cas4 [Candidatus Woesearchaeota archaeon]